jgi:hypothetical protein
MAIWLAMDKEALLTFTRIIIAVIDHYRVRTLYNNVLLLVTISHLENEFARERVSLRKE